jgi:two-component system chemotaxis response regulator CheY
MPALILLVDDSRTVQDLFRIGLAQQGFTVVTAGDGLEGLEKLSQNSVDLVITDVNMPRMDGIRFIISLRKNKAWARLPVIVLSTEKGPHDRQQAAEAGADLFLTKPISPQKLGEHAKGLLEAKTQGG